MKSFRFNITQLLLFSALIGLLAGAYASATSESQRRLVQGLAVSPTGELLVSVGPDWLLVWDLPHTARQPLKIEMEGYVRQCRFLDENRVVVYLADDRNRLSVAIWDLRKQQEIDRRSPVNAITMIAANEDWLIYASDFGYGVQVESMNEPGKASVIPIDFQVLGGTIAADAPIAFVYDDDGRGMLLDLVKAQGTFRLTTSAGASWSQGMCNASLTPNGKSLIHPNGEYLIAESVQIGDHPIIRLEQFHSSRDSFFLIDDGKRVLIEHDGRMITRDIPSGALVEPFPHDLWTHGKLLAASASGNAIATVGTDGEIIVYRGQPFTSSFTVSQHERIRSIISFGVGLIAWAFLWGWVAKRRENQAFQAAVLAHTGQASAMRLLPASLGEMAGRTKRSFDRTYSIALFLLIVLATVVFLTAVSDSWFLEDLAIPCIGIGVIALPFILAAFAMRNRGWPAEHLKSAIEASGKPGTLFYFGRIAAWFSDSTDLARVAIVEKARVLKRFQSMLGIDHRPSAPLLLLVFDEHEQMERYLERPCSLAGVYISAPGMRRIVFSRRSAERRLNDPRATLRSLYGYEMLTDWKGYWPDWWIMMVVAQYLAMGDEDNGSPLARHGRRLQAAFVRGDNVELPLLLSLRNEPLQSLLNSSSDSANAIQLSYLLAMSSTLAEFLLGDDAPAEYRPRFRAFLKGMTREITAEAAFQAAFGFGFAELADDWKQWLRQQDFGVPIQAPDSIREEYGSHYAPQIRDDSIPVEKRVRLMTQLGNAGYLDACELLIPLLDDADAAIRAAARWSLEIIRGDLGGTDSELWRQWLASLPQNKTNVPGKSVSPIVAVPGNALDKEIQHSNASLLCDDAVTPPAGLSAAWLACGLGGIVAIFWSLVVMYDWWGPGYWLSLLHTAAGIFAICQVNRPRRGPLLTAGWLQVATILSCNFFTMIAGIVCLAAIAALPVRWYLMARAAVTSS